MTAHRLDVRVYYEDTDMAGVVYYANYLRYLERGRTEALRALGVDQARLKAETGVVFLVTRVEIDYRRPALFDDMLTIETAATGIGRASVAMAQRVLRGGETLAEAAVRLAAVGANGRAAALPDVVRTALAQLGGDAGAEM
ncbi:MAG: tol-pal system-associated acyl-CoA thioesterase [Rubrimonas sp.]